MLRDIVNDRSVLSQVSVEETAPIPVQKQKQFWQVDIDELKLLYQKKMLTAAGYVYGIVKVLRQDGWWLKFETKVFSKDYGIPQATLYKAITALASDKDLDFEWSAKEIRVRFTKQAPATPSLAILTDEKIKKTAESIVKPLSHSQQGELISPVRKNSHRRENILIREKKFSFVRISLPEKSTQQAFQAPYRYLTDFTDIKQSVRPTETKVSQEQEVIQNPNEPSGNQEDLDRNRESTLKAKNAAPRENDYQKLSFSTNPTDEPEFLSYYKTYRKANGADIKNASAYVAMCIKNEDEGTAEVLNLFSEWKVDCKASQRKISNYADSPAQIQKAKERLDFENWAPYKHEGQLSTLQSLGLKKFSENDVSAAWYKWASAKYPDKFTNIPA